ncbi:cullin-1-like [Impatiens glandulifera]|uniref:cullin-1-like n=1 Tax=Impatiens glandulifera TaxID=253017 RepID=UPI001FB0DECD|nr:cullin-1-like [Impatiens glandulifera]
MAGEDNCATITIEEGWPILQDGINKLIDIVEGVNDFSFTSEEYMNLYTTVYNICQPNPTGPECRRLYEKHNAIYEDYISSRVLPSLMGKKDESLLQEVVKRWKNHKIMIRWTCRFFHYLDRYFVPCKHVPTLQEATNSIFRKLVLEEQSINGVVNELRDSLMSMIDRERNDEEIDRVLVKSVIDMFMEMGEEKYEKDFEKDMLKNTHKFYSFKASKWIDSIESYKDYMIKVEECLKREEERVDFYLEKRTEKKLLEAVEYELMSVHAIKLEKKKHAS